MSAKVSVIVPVFKVERFIEKCIRSLFEQSLDDLEFVFIDDCSPDNSVKIIQQVLKEYPMRHKQTKIIRHSRNQGVSKSRQDGVEVASGEYVIHCDSDDWVDCEMYERMYDEAKAKDADIVCCDFVEHYQRKMIVRNQSINQCNSDIVKDIFLGKIHSSLWSRLIKRSFIMEMGIKFNPSVILMEDMLYVVPLHLSTNKIAYISKSYYHYRMFDKSITHTLTINHVNSELTVLHELENIIEKDSELYRAWEIALTCRVQALITQKELYDPERWRKEIAGIKLYFGSLKNRISPWLVKRHFDTLNFGLICLYRFRVKWLLLRTPIFFLF